jgi:N-methylhydantoinase B/oxoprolinase/acetone carboxylase alpha subunit
MILLFFGFQMRSLGKELRDGDVILTNHPAAGGKKEKTRE